MRQNKSKSNKDKANARPPTVTPGNAGGAIYVPNNTTYKSFFDQMFGTYKANLDLGTLPFFGRQDANPWVITSNDTWFGMPPGYAGSMGEADQEIVLSGNPPWWSDLHNDGYYANGLALLLEYSGGVQGYFDDILSVYIPRYFVYQFLGTTRAAQYGMLNGYDYDPPEAALKVCQEFTGYVILDDEFNWPTKNAIWTTDLLLGSGTSAGHKVYRAVMDRLAGSPVSDAAYEASYQAMWTAYMELVQAKIREVFPNMSGFGRYGWPIGGPHSAYSNATEKARIVAAHNETWAQPFHQILAPSIYMYYKVVPDETVSLNDGEIHKATWRTERGIPFAEEVLRCKSLWNDGRCPVIPYGWAIHDPGGSHDAAGTALDNLNMAECLRMASAMAADWMIWWGIMNVDAGDAFGYDQYNLTFANNANQLVEWTRQQCIAPGLSNVPAYRP